jgi:hypothetical protein
VESGFDRPSGRYDEVAMATATSAICDQLTAASDAV